MINCLWICRYSEFHVPVHIRQFLKELTITDKAEFLNRDYSIYLPGLVDFTNFVRRDTPCQCAGTTKNHYSCRYRRILTIKKTEMKIIVNLTLILILICGCTTRTPGRDRFESACAIMLHKGYQVIRVEFQEMTEREKLFILKRYELFKI